MNRSGRPERVDDYADVAGELAEKIRAVGIASSVAAPITVAGKLWGAIVATTGRPRTFPAYTEQRVASFAELVAHALANVDARQQLAASRARIVEAADSERRRLERNLHDGAQQRLVSLALASPAGRARTSVVTPRRRGGGLTGAEASSGRRSRSCASSRAGSTRRSSRDRGLAAALEALAVPAPLPVELEVVPSDRLARAGRGGRLLPRRRGSDQRGQARAGVRRHRPRRPR